MTTLRTSHLYVSAATLRDLRSMADMLDLDSPDAVAELWLRERLDGVPELASLNAAIAKAIKQAKAEHADKARKEQQL